jgi:hypothetical protein
MPRVSQDHDGSPKRRLQPLRTLLIVSPKTRLWFLAHAPDRVRNFWTEKMGWSDALTREVSDDI